MTWVLYWFRLGAAWKVGQQGFSGPDGEAELAAVMAGFAPAAWWTVSPRALSVDGTRALLMAEGPEAVRRDLERIGLVVRQGPQVDIEPVTRSGEELAPYCCPCCFGRLCGGEPDDPGVFCQDCGCCYAHPGGQPLTRDQRTYCADRCDELRPLRLARSGDSGSEPE